MREEKDQERAAAIRFSEFALHYDNWALLQWMRAQDSLAELCAQTVGETELAVDALLFPPRPLGFALYGCAYDGLATQLFAYLCDEFHWTRGSAPQVKHSHRRHRRHELHPEELTLQPSDICALVRLWVGEWCQRGDLDPDYLYNEAMGAFFYQLAQHGYTAERVQSVIAAELPGFDFPELYEHDDDTPLPETPLNDRRSAGLSSRFSALSLARDQPFDAPPSPVAPPWSPVAPPSSPVWSPFNLVVTNE